jgi:hypothetical protein
LRIGYTKNSADQLSPAAAPLFDQFGIKGIPAFDGVNGLPQISVTNFSQLGDRTFTPAPKSAEVLHITDNLPWTRGNHTLKFGGELRLRKNLTSSSNAARGAFTFNGQFTSRTPGTGAGSALADFLLGLTSSAQLNTIAIGNYRDNYWGVYGNDTWKLRNDLQAILGQLHGLLGKVIENKDSWCPQELRDKYEFALFAPFCLFCFPSGFWFRGVQGVEERLAGRLPITALQKPCPRLPGMEKDSAFP